MTFKRGGKPFRIGFDDVIRHDVTRLLEPERRQLSQDLALVRDSGPEHVVERRDSIGRDDEQRITEVVKAGAKKEEFGSKLETDDLGWPFPQERLNELWDEFGK